MDIKNICMEIDRCDEKFYRKSNFFYKYISSIFIQYSKYKNDKQINIAFDMFFNNKITETGFKYFLEKNFDLSNNEIDIIINKLNNYRHSVKYETDDKALISIIITTYNRKKFLEYAINSLINQSYKNIEIVVMDDCSNDGTEDLMKSYLKDKRIKYFKSKKNVGPGINRLKAYNEKINGEYIIFMDDDDYFIDNVYLDKAIQIHRENRDISFVAADTYIEYCSYDRIDLMNLSLYGEISKETYFKNFQSYEYKKPSSTFTAVFNKKVLDDINIGEMKILNDSIIYLRAILCKNPFFLDNIVGVYRIHNSNITFSCSCNFIVENMEEKIEVYELANKKLNIDSTEGDKWLLNQINNTIFYYLRNSSPKLKDYFTLIRWLKKSQYNILNKLKFKVLNQFIRSLVKK